MFNKYDKPALAMMYALDEISGKGWHPGAYVRQAWLFYQGADDWGFWDALQKVQAMAKGTVHTEMRINVESRRELWIKVDEPD